MKLGETCWKRENIEKAISHIAQLDKSKAHYFLASHSPIRFVFNERLGRNLTEEEFFQMLFNNPRREELALVKGEPGTGKSHLIYWLKLRCESALETGELKNIVPVIIQRRAGSLKDALEQLIQQLPESFTQYLNPVREALGKISEATAREKLADALRHELGEAWQMRKHDPLPRYLKDLREICAVTSCRQWLCREKGVIDRNIKRLIENSETEERERLPTFSHEEFVITDPRYTLQLTPALRDLIDDLTEFRDRREKAAVAFNLALPYALKEMTGLSGATLRGIFDKVRMDLKGMGQSLALFIEDVSVMSALDEEVVNAVEPQGRDDLCPMVAVLGITEAGVSRLAENQRQRVTSFVSVSGYATDQWRADKEEVARFAARYLNSIRLEDEAVKQIAADRRTGGDISLSKCPDCSVQTECHQCFGKVEIDGLAVGMFPFTHDAPQRLLQHLDEQRQGVRRNPRGLLMHVLSRVLSSGDSLERGWFPEDNLPAILPPLLYWRGFQEKYCGGWEPRDIARLERLAKGWVLASTEDEAAILLDPFLAPLQFGKFSRKIQRRERPLQKPEKPVKPKPTQPEPIETPTPQDLLKILQDLDNWIKGEDLRYDQEPRQFLAELIRKGIPWDDDRSVPLSEWKRLVGGGTANYRFIRIEGMRSKVSGNFIIEFQRTKETHDLISALAKFKYLGNNSWEFQNGETDKRTVSTWLKKHTDEIISKLHPPEGMSTEAPVACALQFLAVSSVLRRRAKLPQDVVELVQEILAGTWQEPPTAFNKEWNALIEDMQTRHRDRREFLFNELSIPQGRTGSINFIDPLPIIQHAIRLSDRFVIEPISNQYLQGFWQSRYATLVRMERYAEMPEYLDRERDEWQGKVSQLLHMLSTAGYETSHPKESLALYCEDLLSVVEALKETRLRMPDPLFDDMLKSRMFSDRRFAWGNAVEKARNLADDGTTEQLLLYDPKPLAEAIHALTCASAYLKTVSREVELQLSNIAEGGDPDILTQEFISELQGIASLSEEIDGVKTGKRI
jgi:hypothetical protein